MFLKLTKILITIKPKLKYVALIFLTFALTNCGKPGEEENFFVKITPSSPLIVETPRTIGGTKIEPNWFQLSFTINNAMKYSVRIEEVVVYVNIDGVETGPASFDLGSLGYSDPFSGVSYEYSYCIYTPGLGVLPFAACRNTNGDLDPTLGGVESVGIIFFVKSLPKSKNPANFSFGSRLVIKGVLLEGSEEVDRFQKEEYFSTR